MSSTAVEAGDHGAANGTAANGNDAPAIAAAANNNDDDATTVVVLDGLSPDEAAELTAYRAHRDELRALARSDALREQYGFK